MTPDRTESWDVDTARPDERAQAFRLVFKHLPREDRENRTANALELVRAGEVDPGGILVARSGSCIRGAMIGLSIPGAGSLVWPPRVRSRLPAPGPLEDLLVQRVSDHLRRRGAKLGQALLLPEEAHLAPPLERNGFRHITALWHLRHDLDLPATRPTAAERFTYRPYDAATAGLFEQTLWGTYEQSLDCPEVTGVRDLPEIMEGYRRQGVHRPDWWWLAYAGGRPAGVALLVQTPGTRAADLSYLGVLPAARRQGLGREITCRALLHARQAGMTHVTVAVDGRNRPAWELYRGLGFQLVEQREVYLAIWR